MNDCSDFFPFFDISSNGKINAKSLTCHDTKYPKIFKDFAFILPLEEISKKGKKMRIISHEKMTDLRKSCVTMTDLMDKFYETTELIDVICDEFTK